MFSLLKVVDAEMGVRIFYSQQQLARKYLRTYLEVCMLTHTRTHTQKHAHTRISHAELEPDYEYE